MNLQNSLLKNNVSPLTGLAYFVVNNRHREGKTILQEELIRAHVLPADYDFEAHKELVPMQAGDVPVTYADTTPLEQDFGFRPCTPLREGLRAFAEWHASYYGTGE